MYPIWRCTKCHYLALYPGHMSCHRAKTKRCQDAGVEEGRFTPDFVPRPPPPKPRPGPKPRDFESYFGDKVAAQDVIARIQYLKESPHFKSVIAANAEQIAPLVARVFRLLWGTEAPPQFQSILQLAQRYAIATPDGAEIITKRAHFRRTLVHALLTALADVKDFPPDLRTALARGAEAVGSEDRGDKTLHDLSERIMSPVALEFTALPPSILAPRVK